MLNFAMPFFVFWQIISLSSSANHLSTIKTNADGYAAMIMKVLDKDNIGYIMVSFLDDNPRIDNFSITTSTCVCNCVVNLKQMGSLKSLLLEAETHSISTNSEERKKLGDMISNKLKPTLDPNPLKRWYHKLRFFVLDNWQRIW